MFLVSALDRSALVCPLVSAGVRGTLRIELTAMKARIAPRGLSWLLPCRGKFFAWEWAEVVPLRGRLYGKAVMSWENNLIFDLIFL